ncbi:2-C-methyl-D-erythritol 2,4-cyclodiphosphate synthase [Candidatus Chrysopegis kryptomonas]|uniref:2-C-methyl-D-erythritol 2,4-cyclodiphosphate synthase n=1 Tax=Candidatus Chryseopegocella kryptomonas TaxID=1633643 RepID=A0A0P1N084_9BACT|nr:2-C-methyl-D-erythritol 2,4-cyclodiphosphate synthase [Candidatus Chrysopegis kryptomonas]CUT01862.1 2-C-methyl-D-erythritol 2,4-cyclodiphosphate synthase [Candidatus Chrysopegis kryptomonas]
MRVGIGYDIHPLVEGRKLYIGGVEIPSEKGSLGHSDGDVLIHAICDALLGAIGYGNIGELFPDTDEKFKDAKSEIFLKEVKKILDEKNFEIVNIDSTVILEEIKLSPFVEQIKNRLSSILDLSSDKISVKPKRNEKFDSLGKGEAIACFVVVMVKLKNE